MQKSINKTLNPIAIWRVARAPLNRQKHAPHVFIHKLRLLVKATLASPPLGKAAVGIFAPFGRVGAPLNSIAPPPPPPPPYNI